MKYTTDSFIEQATIIHKNKYSYENTRYINKNTKVLIICKIHGVFEQCARSHLSGSGCKKCAAIVRGKHRREKAKKAFITQAKKIHKNKYKYDNVNYNKANVKVPITCTQHGDFLQTPSSHLQGTGCPKCGVKQRSTKAMLTLQKFINKSNKKHKNKYDYSLISKYKGNKHYYLITCPIHGPFKQRADRHLQGQVGCKKCNGKNITTEDFIQKASKVHDAKYNYTKTIYNKAYEKITITCPKHGDFIQVAHDHLSGNGCQSCGEEIVRKAYLHEPTLLYLLYLEDFNVYKVGITVVRHGIKERYRQDKDLKYKVIRKIYFLDGIDAYKTEKQVLKKYTNSKVFSILKGGNTEIIFPKKSESTKDFLFCIDQVIAENTKASKENK